MIRHIFRRLCLKVAAASIYFCQPLFLCPVHGKGASAKEIIRPLIQAVIITAVKEYDFSVQAAVFCRNFSGGRSLAVFEVPFIFVEVISPFSGIPFICRYKIICTVLQSKEQYHPAYGFLSETHMFSDYMPRLFCQYQPASYCSLHSPQYKLL